MTATARKTKPDAPVAAPAPPTAATEAARATARKPAPKPAPNPAPGPAHKASHKASRKTATQAATPAAPKPAPGTPPSMPEKVARAAAVSPAAAAKPARAKEKLVRDSFTMPQADFALIHQLKERAMGFRRAAKKSELLRAGLQALSAMDDSRLQALLAQLPALKAGRPKESG